MESAPQFSEEESEPAASAKEYVFDPSSYRDLRESEAKKRALENGLEPVVVERDGRPVHEVVGIDRRRLQLWVLANHVLRSRLG